MKESIHHSRVYLKLYLLFIGILVSQSGITQNIAYSNQQWFQYYNKWKFQDRWMLLTDGGYRFSDGFQKKSQFLVRSALGYQMNQSIRWSAGIAYLGFYGTSKLKVEELRTHQELTIIQKRIKYQFKHRFRLEERCFNTVNPSNNEKLTRFNLRWRYRFIWSILLHAKKASKPQIWLNIGNEILLNSGKEVQDRIFDQNRILLGTSLKLNANWTFTLTYNHQWKSTALPDYKKQDYVIWVGVKQTIDSFKD